MNAHIQDMKNCLPGYVALAIIWLCIYGIAKGPCVIATWSLFIAAITTLGLMFWLGQQLGKP